MRINLPHNTPANVVKRIRVIVRDEKLFNAYFPQTTAIHLTNPSGIVTFTGKGNDSVAAQMLFRVVNNLLIINNQS